MPLPPPQPTAKDTVTIPHIAKTGISERIGLLRLLRPLRSTGIVDISLEHKLGIPRSTLGLFLQTGPGEKVGR
jgi:hypothetical protein